MQNKIVINDLKVGDKVQGVLAIVNSKIEQASNGPYLLVELTDGTDMIIAKKWQISKSAIAIPKNNVVYITGTVGEYRGIKDINIDTVAFDHAYDIMDFRKQNPNEYSNQVLFDKIKDLVLDLPPSEVKDITLHILIKYMEELLISPAAKGHHHRYVGGLLQHTYEVVCIAKAAVSCCNERIIDHTLLVCGAILHDIGKLRTYKWDGVDVVVTDTGKFLDHIVAGIIMIEEAQRELIIEDSPIVLHLKHIICSHHGKYEWGSPVLPSSPEALLVHEGDMISSRMDVLSDEKTKGPGWRDKVHFMFGTRLYMGEDNI